MLSNLLLNALKFSRPGTDPQVSIYAERDAGEWRICVQDDGMGIDPDHAERIFKMFQRLHSRSDYPGTGIGLAICKRIVERHGGRIWVQPAPEQGSLFCFTLTAAAPDRAARGEEAMA